MAKLPIFGCFLLLACTSQALPSSKLQLSLAKGESNIDIVLNDTLSQIEKITHGALGDLDSLEEKNAYAVKEKMENVQSTVNAIISDVGTTINELIQFVESLGEIYEDEKANIADSSVSDDNNDSEVPQGEGVDTTEPSVSEDNEASDVSKNNETSEVSQDQDVGAAESCDPEKNESSAVSEDKVLDTADSSNIMKPSTVPWPYMLVYYPVPVFPWPYMLQQYPPPSEMKAPSYPWSYMHPHYPPQEKMDPPSLPKKKSP